MAVIASDCKECGNLIKGLYEFPSLRSGLRLRFARNDKSEIRNAFLLAGLLLSGCIAPGKITRQFPEEKRRPLRIAILENVGGFSLSSDGTFRLEAEKNISLSADRVYRVTASGGKIILGEIAIRSPARIEAVSRERLLRAEGRSYRGNLLILAKQNSLLVINEVDLEEYLWGVLPREVGTSWPSESLKAQAVASRTFALKNLGKYETKGFDLTASVSDQVYGGADSEHQNATLAVNATRAEVLTFHGALIDAPFHSNCGGKTEAVREVWGDPKRPGTPYLSGVKCRFGQGDPAYHWEREISLSQMENALGVSEIQAVTLHGQTGSGRVKEIRFRHRAGDLSLRGARFRNLLGPSVVRSTNFEVKLENGKIKFRGKGWGHGVGLCQWGARGQALEERGYEHILRYYYPGTRLEKWKP